MFFSSLCSPVTKKTNDNDDAKELIDQFDTLIKALEMQIRKKKHECEEHKLKAKNLYVDTTNNKDEVLMEMRIRADKQKKYKEWLGLLENLHKVRNQVDCSTPYVDIIDTFKNATKHLEKFDLDDIENTLQTLNDATTYNNIFDDDAILMKELNNNNNNIEEEEEEIYLPSVPVRKIEEQKKIKILV